MVWSGNLFLCRKASDVDELMDDPSDDAGHILPFLPFNKLGLQHIDVIISKFIGVDESGNLSRAISDAFMMEMRSMRFSWF
eukprot:2170929-Karenia_brevis.AAC.1